MSGKQTAVLWMGLLLIAAQFYFGGQFHQLFTLVQGGNGPANSPSKVIAQGNHVAPNGGKGAALTSKKKG